MKLKVIVHEAEEGGYWAEVPAIAGCATQGETFEELLKICMRQSKAVYRLHKNQDLKVGLLRHLLKSAELTENDL